MKPVCNEIMTGKVRTADMKLLSSGYEVWWETWTREGDMKQKKKLKNTKNRVLRLWGPLESKDAVRIMRWRAVKRRRMEARPGVVYRQTRGIYRFQERYYDGVQEAVQIIPAGASSYWRKQFPLFPQSGRDKRPLLDSLPGDTTSLGFRNTQAYIENFAYTIAPRQLRTPILI